MANDLKISNAATMDGKDLVLELSDGTTLILTLEQVLSLRPEAVMTEPDDDNTSNAN